MKIDKLWGGRFEEMPSKEMVDFLSGRDVKGTPPCDERLIPCDLWGSRAHVLMLCRQGILSGQDGKKLLKGLREIEGLFQRGKFQLDASKEDVHSNIESYLIERSGIDIGGKIHTGRSRNDQIVLDMRLYLRDQVLEFADGLILLIESLLRKAGENTSAVMPGYTHTQHATLTTFGHLLLSFAEALSRDVQRLMHWFALFNKNPLGGAAGYGTTFHLDRKLTSSLLGFDGPTENVTDSIMQRWEPETELAYTASVMMDHLSALAQTLILLSTHEFDMIRLSDRHCSGSSIMPQKRNPDTLEVIRAKTAFAHGILISLLSTGKSLFVGYNRETQWTKYWIMDLTDEVKPVSAVMADIIRLLRVNKPQMLKQAQKNFLGATPLMEWLVHQGSLPMRKAKMVVEKAVRYSEKEGLEYVSYQSLKKALVEMRVNVPVSEKDVESLQKPERILAQLLSAGFPAPKRVEESIRAIRKKTETHRKEVHKKRTGINNAKALVLKMEKMIKA